MLLLFSCSVSQFSRSVMSDSLGPHGPHLLGETGTLRKEALLGPGIWCRSSRAAPPSCPPRCQNPRLRADQLIGLDSPPPFLDRRGEAGVAIFSLQLLCLGSCEVPGAWGCGAEGYRVGARSGALANPFSCSYLLVFNDSTE